MHVRRLSPDAWATTCRSRVYSATMNNSDNDLTPNCHKYIGDCDSNPASEPWEWHESSGLQPRRKRFSTRLGIRSLRPLKPDPAPLHLRLTCLSLPMKRPYRPVFQYPRPWILSPNPKPGPRWLVHLPVPEIEPVLAEHSGFHRRAKAEGRTPMPVQFTGRGRRYRPAGDFGASLTALRERMSHLAWQRRYELLRSETPSSWAPQSD